MMQNENRIPPVRHFDTLSSTNDYLRERWQEEEDLLTVRAIAQTKGRGRLQREWASPVGGLWFSVLFKNITETPSHYQRLLGVAALSAIETLESHLSKIAAPSRTLGARFYLKWPNDLVYTTGGPNFTKIGGILQENVVLSETRACIVGVGINVNNPIPADLREKAVSLQKLFLAEVPIEDLLRGILLKVVAWRADVTRVLQIWRQRSLLQRGSQVEIYSESEGLTLHGEILDTPVESIELLCANGVRRRFFAGDVRLCAANPAEGSPRRL